MRKKRKIHRKAAEPLECGRNVMLSSSTSGSALDWSPIESDQGNSWSELDGRSYLRGHVSAVPQPITVLTLSVPQ